MIDLDYIFYHTDCIWRMIRGDERAFKTMDLSADGFWRSFIAIIASLPAMLFVYALAARDEIRSTGIGNMGFMVTRDLVIDLFMWLLMIVLLAWILPFLGKKQHFAGLVIARNWLMVLANYFIALAYFPMLFLPTGSAIPAFLVVSAIVVFLIYLAKITRIALDSSLGMASALVGAEVVISIGLIIFFSAASM